MTDEYIPREAALKAIYTSTAPTLEIEAIPAADVVEVIRCKDCHFSYHTLHGEMYCNRLRCRWGDGERYYWVNDEDYCSWGVWRADNG